MKNDKLDKYCPDLGIFMICLLWIKKDPNFC